MHLLQARPGAAPDGAEAVDLGQTPGDIVFLSAADTELASLAAARAGFGDDFPSLRLANLMQLAHPMSVDLYVESIISRARLVIVRLLGGVGYWPYGVEQIAAACRAAGTPFAFLPGGDQPDAELAALCSLDAAATHRLWQYCVEGGAANARNLLGFAASLIGHESDDWAEPAPLPRAGFHHPELGACELKDVMANWRPGAPVAAIVFYRAHVQAMNLAPIDALAAALAARGVNPLPVYATSLKDPVSADVVAQALDDTGASLVLNTTGFAVSAPGAEWRAGPFDGAGGRPSPPVLQVVLAGQDEESWAAGTQGLSARDLAMNVALPEVDGRVLTRAVSFKATARFDERTECPVVTYAPRADRIDFVAALARAWIDLARCSVAERRVAIVLANYPNRDARLGNGVGLDTPAGTLELLRAMAAAGYRVGDLPPDGNALINALAAGPTNAEVAGRVVREQLALADYLAFFDALPDAARRAVKERWGAPERDPFFVADAGGQGAFALPAMRFGNVVLGLQPARGYHIDPAETYHDPALVPPHGYLAFHAWLRNIARVHAVVHMGKHGNLEWLPGKALALSRECWPEVALGPLPHVYPFIVNDPGEGSQAKRRAQAVIVDHLTPPLTRAGSYGPLAELERLVDEYYEASGADPRRLPVLRDEILALAARHGLDRDCGINTGDASDAALAQLDTWLCELKEMQIRDGLHVFGRAPDGDLLEELLVALARVPRGADEARSASLTRAIARDLELDDFDPLACEMGAPWTGARPAALEQAANGAAWRTAGDTVERIEALARALVDGSRACSADWTHTAPVLAEVNERLRPAVVACGEAEINGVLTALDGRFLEPGPAGAPTRGRPDVLPTGRNFYSVDTRTVPTPAAWRLGWHSASLLIDRHRQEQGAWPRRMALCVWGTSNMRTGGDDIAQAFALMGVQPTWETASGRVTGFEIMPLGVLARPRVDVTLRVSGFFRDAFPAQIELFDRAARAVARLDDESPEDNPAAAAYADETAELVAAGVARRDAERRAGYRVFGSKPGAYGAGLQALIDERGWRDEADLARAWIVWGGYAYGAGAEGVAEHARFETRLRGVEAVVQNQDNREHDLLDSDDYYQFEGGLSAAVHHVSGARPVVWHNDHSRPENPRVRRLEEEIARVVRARVVNPKWIRGVMRHGYKGAFEMAATVDYMFAFAATARAVADHHFDAVFEAWLEEDEVRAFLQENSPDALREIAERLTEAIDRGLWRPRSNSAHAALAGWAEARSQAAAQSSETGAEDAA